MKTIIYSIVIVCSIVISSCGPTASEQAAIQQIHDDSVANATAQKLELQHQLQTSISNIKNAIANTKADLEIANDEMQRIKQFKLLRSASEREEQIRSQLSKIDNITHSLEDLNTKLNENESLLASYQ